MKLLPSIAAVATAWEQPSYADFLKSLAQKKSGWGAPTGRISALWSLCPALTPPDNGSVVCDMATCALVCDEGFMATGRRRTKCRFNQKRQFFWKKTLAECDTCTDISAAPAGVEKVCSFNALGKKKCQFKCANGEDIQSSGGSFGAITSICTCPRWNDRVCGWNTRKLGKMITDSDVAGFTCPAAPTTTTQAPATTTQAPASTTAQPPASSTAQPPASTTQAPASTTAQPPASTTVQLSASTTAQPPASTTQASASTTTQPPASTTQAPATPTSTTIMVILQSLSDSYIINGDGSSRTAAQISAPGNANDYTKQQVSAVVADKLYIFGGATGDNRKIARLESCTIVELTVKLNNDYGFAHAALASADNSQALICFGNNSPHNYCDIFDGSNVVTTFSTTYPHNNGRLGYYNGQPTTVGSWLSDGHRKVETLSQNGWTSLADHPINVRGYNLIGLENGDMLLIGGYDNDSEAFQSKVWRLSSNLWTEEATLQKAVTGGSAIKLHNQIYSFGGRGIGESHPIQRLDLAGDGTVDQIELIGNHDDTAYFWRPILYIVDANTCTNN